MTGHEKECALAAYAFLMEKAKRAGNRKELAGLRREYREILAAECISG
jgi:hypothetical protein